MSLTDWMTQWRRRHDDDQTVRSVLGRLLFSGDEVKKSVKVISGGEEGRMLFGKLMLQEIMYCSWTNRPTTSTWNRLNR